MSTPNDGGPAFPIPFDPQGEIDPPNGMSLRDWFAGQALNGLISQLDERVSHQTDPAKLKEWRESLCKEDAEACYRLADAMLAARERKEDA